MAEGTKFLVLLFAFMLLFFRNECAGLECASNERIEVKRKTTKEVRTEKSFSGVERSDWSWLFAGERTEEIEKKQESQELHRINSTTAAQQQKKRKSRTSTDKGASNTAQRQDAKRQQTVCSRR